MNLCDYSTIRELLSRHGFHFSKSLGQNFLIDASIPIQIAEASGADDTCCVLEIGPGIGPLTSQLARRARKVVAVELDQTLLPVLAETLADFSNVEVISGDIMKLDLPQLVQEHFDGLTPIVCANLPYNITTPVLTKLAESGLFHSLTVMIQKEVAQRVCAAPGAPECGAFSLLMQYRMNTELLFDVPKECFHPAPKVTSAVIRCTRLPAPAVSVSNEAFFFRVIRGAFLLRRKTLLNSLSSAFPEYGKDRIRSAITACGLPETVRGERLSLQQLAALSELLLPQEK